MELRHLRYFVAVAEKGTFRGAAEKLRVSQPALSKQVRDLEDEVGVCLFVRKATGAQLTAAGRTLYAQAGEILSATEAAVQKARDAEKGRSGMLRVGVVGVLVSNILPHVLAAFHAKYPEVDVKLNELFAQEQFAALGHGTIDVGLTALPDEKRPPWLGHRVIKESKFVIAMREGHVLAHRPSLRLEELSRETFLCFAHARQYSGHAERLREIFGHFGLPMPRIKMAEDYESLVALVIGGQGITLVPPLSTSVFERGIVLKPIRETAPLLNLQIHAIWDEEHLEKCTERFIRILDQTMRASAAPVGDARSNLMEISGTHVGRNRK